MKLEKNKNQDMTIYHEYKTKHGTFEVLVKYITEDELDEITEGSKKIVWRQHQKLDQIDDKRFRKAFLKKAFLELRGAKRIHLRYMIEPTVKIKLTGKETWEDSLELTDELKKDIIENINAPFNTFLFSAAREIDWFVEKLEMEETQNLSNGSDTGKQKT
jgi:hypothetical protein